MAPAAITCHHLPALCQHGQGQAVVAVLRVARLPGSQFETGGLWLALPHPQIVALDPGSTSGMGDGQRRGDGPAGLGLSRPAALYWRNPDRGGMGDP